MSDIEIVIKIPEEDYLTFSELSEKEKVNELTYYERIIANGTPLPKGHGRLKDTDKFNYNSDNYITKHGVESAPTIIEADKEDT